MPPIRSAVSRCTPKVHFAAVAANTKVIGAQTKIRLRTALPTPRRSRSRRLRPPSKRMTATERDTNGSNASPKIASGSIRPVNGPTTKPARSKRRIDGSRKRHASHCTAMPRMRMLARGNIVGAG